MSKYSYTTVYEEFTGLKPPEPKTTKPRRRRGFGHPYRMRLSMQEDAQQPELQAEQPQTNSANSQPEVTPSPKSLFRANMNRQEDAYDRPHRHHAPKVTYKKRRHYLLSDNNKDAMS
ncbi:hypothetical protein [Candidatus Sororendozoicomonas aggregata]|uniref:hypothetical protein n=1 Tax=Candidatus Sororendozoicomonas aggregata TaxID=3073239 RepID=UPI002ECFC84C